ncbi:helix-turn-helix domain-containing protein [Candidatus Poriferisodalis sp.]|uniref:helix-turn-helix domain-containing protein n=1 Tax=Candidatus Poriferisodalis sp. TaxID=3101277 RepID=UPI003B018C12
MSHADARLTPAGRLLLVERTEAGTTQAEVARQMDLARGTVAKWWHRYQAEGVAGLADRSRRPHRFRVSTDSTIGDRSCPPQRSTTRGPTLLSVRTGVPQAAMLRVLRRHDLNRLSWMDCRMGRVIHRY